MIAAGVLAVSCGGDSKVTGPSVPQSSYLISDAAHGGAVASFYFLPPMVPEPDYNGSFASSLDVAVTICALDPGGVGCATPQPDGFPLTYDMTTGPGSETVRVDPENELYIVNWHTDQFALEDGTFYRISVWLDGRQLGFVDVDVVSSGGQLKNVATDEYIALKDGRTLPIKFRVESAPPVAASDAYAMNTGETLDVPAGTGPPDGLLVNDDAGFPGATILTFGAGDLGGSVSDHPAGTSVALAGGTLTVGGTGAFTLVGPTDAGTFTFEYRLANGAGSSDATVTVTISSAVPQPDLVFQSCTVTPSDPLVTDRVDIDLVLANDGDADAIFPTGYNYGIRLVGGGGYGGTSSSGLTIPAGSTHTVSFYWPPLSHDPGTYTLSAVADVDNRIVESNEDNNTIACGSVTVSIPTDLPDLVITDVSTTTSPVTSATDFQFLITVENRGTAPATIPYNYQLPSQIIFSAYSAFVYQTNQAGWTLNPGESQTFSAAPNWGYLPIGTYDISFTVDPGDKVYESDESNNTFTRSFTVLDASGGS